MKFWTNASFMHITAPAYDQKIFKFYRIGYILMEKQSKIKRIQWKFTLKIKSLLKGLLKQLCIIEKDRYLQGSNIYHSKKLFRQTCYNHQKFYTLTTCSLSINLRLFFIKDYAKIFLFLSMTLKYFSLNQLVGYF